MKKTLFFLCFFLALSCTNENASILKYFPEKAIFKTGYANKYYNHYRPYDPNSESQTRISYASYQLLENNVIEIRNYNAGFELRGWQYYHLQKGGLKLDSAWYLSGSDTVRARIEAGIMKNFQDTGSTFYRENYEYQGQENQYISHQYKKADTLINENPGLHFYYNRSYRNLEKDSTIQDWQAREIYLEGLGFWSSWEESYQGVYQTELMEQMPLADFEKRAQHQKKRIAYIDPSKSLGSAENFKLCKSETEIVDYYNGEPDAEFAAGKKALVKLIQAESKNWDLSSFEGMLTLRFVISCEGLAGRFIAEAYDFNYQKITVPVELSQRVVDYLCLQGPWQATIVRDEARDAYAYLTLKIKDEAITDILP